MPIITGISMGSTVSSGQGSGMRVGVGNTLYGAPQREAANPQEVRAYRGADRYVPRHEVSTLPEVQAEVRAKYPEEARKAGIEGRVRLRLSISAEGVVTEARVLKGLGYGLDEAAQEATLRFRFKAATVDGEGVATEIDYTYTFLLD